jgi:hypothetical protein
MKPDLPDRRRSVAGFGTALALIAALGLTARLVFALAVPTRPIEDFWSYLLRGEALAQRGEYAALAGRPDASYPPGYPLVLTLAHASPVDPVLSARLLNALLGTGTILLAGLAGRSLWNPAAGLAAAGLAALDPRALATTGILASENLFAPLLLAWILLWSRSLGRAAPAGRRLAAAAGAVLGLLTLTRSIGWLLGLLWPAGSLMAGRKLRAVAAEAAILLAVQHAVLLPWALRNQATLGRFTVLTSVGGVNLFIGNSEGATGGWYAWRPALEEVRPGLDDLSVMEVDAAAGEAAKEWIRRHPRRALALYRAKLGKIVLGDESYVLHYSATGRGNAIPAKGVEVIDGPHPLKRHAPRVLRALDAFQRAVFWAGMAGIVGLLATGIVRRSRPAAAQALVLLGGAAYFVLLAAVFLASTRFRWPTMDLLRLAAALPAALLLKGLLPERWFRTPS